MKSQKHPQIVVGAGLPGITASLALAKHGRDVILIDSEPTIGGLLRSYEVGGFIFDFGTHFASYTGIDDLDELLFDGTESEWVKFPGLRSGNFWNGILNSASDNPDLNSLGRKRHDQCLAEILHSPGWHEARDPVNAQEYLFAEYGPHLVAEFFDPVLKKFTGLSSDMLHFNANLLFGLKRFAVLDAQATAELKCSNRYDARVAFHHRDHSPNHKESLYPRAGGIGKWIEQLEDKLRISGVRIINDARIEKIAIDDMRVKSLIIDGAEFKLDSLIWSTTPAQFCKLAGIPIATGKPMNRSTVLVGLEFDQNFLTDCHYVTIFDTEFAAFRITFYPNFSTRLAGRYGATVEFLVDPDEVTKCDWVLVAESEMRKIGVVGDGATVKSRHERIIWNSFPIQSNESIAVASAQVQRISDFSNVNLIGRASGNGWLLNDLIINAFNTALETLSNPFSLK
jgi:protoporphyrinogen oxidase